eukprot:5266631-Karenia_brevis.AAC.1
MHGEGMLPEVINFNAATSCGKGRQWLPVALLFDGSSREDSSTDMTSFNAAISACMKGGQWQRVA